MVEDRRNNKAKLNWSKIRQVVFGSQATGSLSRLKTLVVDPSAEPDVQGKTTKTFSHGIKLLNEVHVEYTNGSRVGIKQVIHCDAFKSYLIVLSDGNLCQYNENKEQEVYRCSSPVLSVCFAGKFKNYVTVCADHNLRILDKNLELINSIPYTGTIHGICYNIFTHEIITYGVGSLNVWLFRTSGTILIPKLVISDKISAADVIVDVCVEKVRSEEQRCFSIVKNGVVVHTLLTGACLQSLTGMHDSIITKLLYVQALKLLITSSKDGCIKSWKENGNLHCIFVGHAREITSLSLFPYGNMIISTSNDNTIRTWSLESNSELDCHRSEDVIRGVGTESGVDFFFSFTESRLQMWRVNNLHLPFLSLRSRVDSIKMTTNPKLPPVVYCVSNGRVYVICPINATIVTVFVALPISSVIVDVVYHLSESLLLVLFEDGSIVCATTTTYPCSVKYAWSSNMTNQCRCISLYEYMPQMFSADDQWKELNNNGYGHMDNSSDKTLFFGGCTDGSIAVYEWMEGKTNGSINFSLQAHTQEITALCSNPKMDQLASTSKDRSLKVWRVFPFAEEALTPLLLFEHSMFIYGMVFSNKSLCVIYQDIARAYHTIGIYKTNHDAKERCITQDIMKDHTDEILSIAACPKLQLVASASKDGTVHIRNTENDLIVVLKLNDVAHCISFGSQRGNLLLAIGTNIHIIDYQQYLPQQLTREMVGMKFVDCEKVPVVEVNTDMADALSEELPLDRGGSSALQFVVDLDVMSEAEKRRREEKDRVRREACSVLEARDKELNLIKEGKLSAKKSSKLTSLDRDIAFQKYLDMFYKRPDVPHPEDDPMEDVDEDRFIVKVDSSWRPPPQDEGFFAVQSGRNDIEKIKERIKKSNEDQQRKDEMNSKGDEVKARSLSIATDKVDLSVKQKVIRHPNSASSTYVERLNALKKINQQLGGKRSVRIGKFHVASDEYPLNEVTKTKVNKESVKKFKETTYDGDECENILPVAPDGILPNSVVVALYKELLRENAEDDGLKDWKPAELTEEQLAEVNRFNSSKKVKKVETPPPPAPPSWSSDSSFIPEPEEKTSAIMSQLIEIKETMPEHEVEDLATPPETPPPSPPPPQPVEVPKEAPKRKPITKLVSTAVVVEAAVKFAPEPPPPPLPLPHFILQFSDLQWYKMCFPDLTSKTFDEPHTVAHFLELLIAALKKSSLYEIKCGIIDAMILLYGQEAFDEPSVDLIITTLLSELNKPGSDSQKGDEKQEFIRKCFQLLLLFREVKPIVLAELMVQFILGSASFRKEIQKSLDDLEVHDSKGYFPAELLTFDVSLVVPSQQKNKLNELSLEWLSTWTKKLREHITALTGKIARASRAQNRRGTLAPQAAPQGILKKKGGKRESVSQDKSIKFVSDNFVGAAARNVSAIDAVNYFCEVKFEEELERLRQEAAARKSAPNTKDRNTILSIPKLDGIYSLVRLGETHKSLCHPERETALAHVLPPVNASRGIRSLVMHLNTLKLTPFPDELDELIYTPGAGTDLITLRHSRKYFVPASSFVDL